MHEVLLLAKDKDTDPSQLKEIVEEVNLTDAVSTDFCQIMCMSMIQTRILSPL